MKKLFTLLLIGLSTTARADFSSDVELFHMFNMQDVAGIKIVRELPAKNALAKAGVRKGDVVYAWNYRNIDSMESARAAYSAQTIHNVNVMRNGKPLFIGSAK